VREEKWERKGGIGWNRGEGRQMEGKVIKRRPGGMRRKSFSPFMERSI
jgi:hypothetical protein